MNNYNLYRKNFSTINNIFEYNNISTDDMLNESIDNIKTKNDLLQLFKSIPNVRNVSFGEGLNINLNYDGTDFILKTTKISISKISSSIEYTHPSDNLNNPHLTYPEIKILLNSKLGLARLKFDITNFLDKYKIYNSAMQSHNKLSENYDDIYSYIPNFFINYSKEYKLKEDNIEYIAKENKIKFRLINDELKDYHMLINIELNKKSNIISNVRYRIPNNKDGTSFDIISSTTLFKMKMEFDKLVEISNDFSGTFGSLNLEQFNKIIIDFYKKNQSIFYDQVKEEKLKNNDIINAVRGNRNAVAGF